MFIHFLLPVLIPQELPELATMGTLKTAAASLSVFSRHNLLSRKSIAYSNYFSPCISFSAPILSYSFSSTAVHDDATPSHSLVLCSALQEVEFESESDKTQEAGNVKRKLFVLNLPWSFSVADIKELFAQCGTVKDVEIIKKKQDGKNRNFAFLTMASGEEAQAVIDKFDSQDVSGRIIKVEFAKRLKKKKPGTAASPPSPLEGEKEAATASSPPSPPEGETRHKIYVSNLAWKVRTTHLREFFSVGFKPISARVVYQGTGGKSAGYGFVSFATREEADAAVSALNEKELMGRSLRLKISEKTVEESKSQKNEEEQNIVVSEAKDL